MSIYSAKRRFSWGLVLLAVALPVVFGHSPGLRLRPFPGGQPFRSGPPAAFVPGQVLVKFKTSLGDEIVRRLLVPYRARPLAKIPAILVYRVEIATDGDPGLTAAALNRNPEVLFAEPNATVWMAVTPNDPLFRFQYALFNSSQEIGPPGSPQGTTRADIKATAAWEETKGSADVLLAVLDTGVDASHPDLKDKLPSAGRDFVHGDSDAADDHGHGTLVAGIAAACSDNGLGIAGVSWKSPVLAVKVLDAEGRGTAADAAAGIIWAADSGARVINMSLGGLNPSETLKEALKYAYDKNVVIVAAAGNGGGTVYYPAAYDDYCLAVAATDFNDQRPEWSNAGPEVDVAAPGDRIISLVPTWYWEPGFRPYAYASGTSLAAAHVAGLAALIRAAKPWLNPAEIMEVIRLSADDVNASAHPGRDAFIGAGRINMEKALVPIRIKSP